MSHYKLAICEKPSAAATIERIISAGLVERTNKTLRPSDKGKRLISVLPEVLKSAKLTADWEHMLLQIQRGELTGAEFMDGIIDMTTRLVKDNAAVPVGSESLFAQYRKQPQGEAVGVCPRCGASVREGNAGFFCDTQSCGFKLWKASKFWTAKKKLLTATIVAALLKDGRVDLKDLHSEKTGKKYDAAVILDDTGDGYVNFKLDFGGKSDI